MYFHILAAPRVSGPPAQTATQLPQPQARDQGSYHYYFFQLLQFASAQKLFFLSSWYVIMIVWLMVDIIRTVRI